MNLQHAQLTNTVNAPNFSCLAKKYKDAVIQFLQYCQEPSNLSSFYYIKRQILPAELRHFAEKRASEMKLAELPSDVEIEEFRYTLETSSHVIIDEQLQRRISYEHALSLLDDFPARVQRLLPLKTLFKELTSSVDEKGLLTTNSLVQFVSNKCLLSRYRLVLWRYADSFTGYINRKQLIAYLENEVFPVLSSICEMEANERQKYLNTVLSMFFFFLDPHKFGRCRATDIILSGFVENLFALQKNSSEDEQQANENWFDPQKTRELVCLFKMLDEKNTGYITEAEFMKLNDGAYTNAFVQRLFEVHVKDDGHRMTFDEFVTFQIASEHMAHPSAVKYYFSILDLNEDGYLTSFEFKYFHRSLKYAYCNFVADSEAMPSLADFMDSLFDFVQPKSTERISLNDVLNSKQGYEFILYLINYVEFSRFENREDGTSDTLGFDDMDIDAEADENSQPSEFHEAMMLEAIKEESEPVRSLLELAGNADSLQKTDYNNVLTGVNDALEL